MIRRHVIRLARLEDVLAVTALERSTPDAPHWHDAVYSGYVGSPSNMFQAKALFVATAEERVTGFLAITALAGEAEVESIAVAEAVWRTGLGSLLLEAGMLWAISREANILRLEVRSANLRALAFYVSMGFKQAGLRREYYKEPVDDAVLMLRDIAGSQPAGKFARPGDL